MNLTAVRLTLRLHRFAISGIGLVVLALVSLAVWYAARLDGVPESTACLMQGGDQCRAYLGLHEEASRILVAIGFAPIILGPFLGVPIVAQELERSTTPLAWSLEPSRWRWLVHRSVPVMVVAAVLGLLAGAAADHLEARLFPFANPGASFHDFGLRGPIVAARVLLALGSGLLIGALVGRSLLAILLASLVATLLIVAVATVRLGIQAREAVPVAYETIDNRFAALQVDFRYQLPTGELVTWEQLAARFPDPDELDRQLSSTRQLVYVIPAERYGSASAVEAAATSALGLSLIAAAVLTVTRRHPDPGRIRFGFPKLAVRRRRRRGVPLAANVGLASATRLVLWPHRLELVAGAAVGLVVSVGCAVVVGTLASISPPAECLKDLANIPATPECATAGRFLEVASEWGNRLFAAMAVLPWVVGALIGVVVVGREIENRTASLAWSLSPDRRRWLINRALLGGALVVLLLVLPSVLATEMQRMARPWVAPESTLDNYALRGPLVVARGLAAFSVALLVGAYLGRILPGLLLAGLLCVALVLALELLWPFGQPSESVPRPDPRVAGPLDQDSIPGERLQEVELREGLFLAGVSVAFVIATTAVVERRTPY